MVNRMPQTAAHIDRIWSELLDRLRAEIQALPPEERRWIAQRLAAITLLQEELHACAAKAGSEAVCADCIEVCCDRGKHHTTLVNLLFYLFEGQEPPHADFSRPCPQLSPAGCLYPPGRRPFNCVTFNCAAVEDRMPAAARERFYTLEPALRALYESFDLRYAGSSLRGLLIRAERLGSRPLLSRPAPD